VRALSRCARMGRDLLYRGRLFLTTTVRRKTISPRSAFQGTSDRYWYWVLARGWQANPALRGVIPGLPSERIQQNWTGSAGDATLREGYDFYRLVRDLARKHQRDIRPDSRVLDFGCGWGRMIRFFLRDVDSPNLVGCDCYAEALEAARKENIWCDFRLVDPMPPSPFPSASFDVIYLYSVFSHLSEEAHLRWLTEFHRLLRPGGLLFVTTRKRDFILQCAALRQRLDVPEHVRGSRASFADSDASLKRYDAGAYCHSATGGGGVLDAAFYGETCIPRAYVEREWGRLFRVLEFLDDTRCPQALIVAAKPHGSP
jgi:SAM-dependent methyltransferase